MLLYPLRRYFTCAATAFTIVSGLAGCWVTNAQGDAMGRDIKSLQGHADAAKKSIDEQRAQLTEQMTRAEKQISDMNAALTDLNRAARMTDADFGVMLEEMRKEMAQLRGQIELANYRLAQLEGKLEGETSLMARLEALEKQAAKRPETPPAPPAEAPKDKAGLLGYGKDLAKKGSLDEARGVFRDVIKKWPKDQGTTDAARYELGELYFKEQKWRNALPEYIEIVEKFAAGELVDDAYWRIALCSAELGNLEDAKVFLQEILNKHKSSPLAKSAKTKLGEVEKRLEKEATDKKKKK